MPVEGLAVAAVAVHRARIVCGLARRVRERDRPSAALRRSSAVLRPPRRSPCGRPMGRALAKSGKSAAKLSIQELLRFAGGRVRPRAAPLLLPFFQILLVTARSRSSRMDCRRWSCRTRISSSLPGANPVSSLHLSLLKVLVLPSWVVLLNSAPTSMPERCVPSADPCRASVFACCRASLPE